MKAVLAAALAAVSCCAWGSPEVPATTQTLDPVIVTATRTELAISEATASTIVIERDDIERALPGDLAELLRFHAGLELGRNGGAGQFTSIFTRGGESNHTLVLVDGIRANPASAGGAALQNIAPELIERIEIVKGPRTTLYGSDAIAGVINIITRAPNQDSANLEVRGGADDTRGVSGGFTLASETRGVSVQAEQQTTDGIPVCSDGGDDRGYDRSSFNVQARQQWGLSNTTARFWHTQGNNERVDYCGDFGNNPLDQDFRNQVLELTSTLQLSKAWQSTVSLSRMVDRIEQQQANYLGEFDHIETTRPRLDWQNVIALGAQRISLGVDWARESVRSRSFGNTYDIDTDVVSAYLQDEISQGPHRVLGALSYTDHESFGERLNWNADYGYQWLAATRLVASAGTGFRAPDADDRFGFGGDPDLKAEKSRSLEIGVQQGFGARHQVDLRAFQANVDDLIVVVFDPANDPDVDFGFRAVNIARYRNRGVEATYRGSLGALRWMLSGIEQRPRDRDTDEPLLRRAKRSATLSLVQGIASHEIGIDVLASGQRPDVGGVTDGGYTLLNLNGRLRFTPAWSLGLRVENLLDKDYVTAAGYRQPGLGAFVSLRYSI